MPDLTMPTMLVGLGAVALAFFWIHMLLIAAAAWKDLRGLRKHLDSFGTLQNATVDGEVKFRVVQVGRSKGDGLIHFHDRAYETRHEGLVLHLGDGRDSPQAIPPQHEVELWVDPARIHEAGRCPDAESFEAAHVAARKARGFARDIEVAVAPGTKVWTGQNAQGTRILASHDPVAFVRSRALMAFGLTAGVTVLLLACTTAVLWPPLLGTVGKAGALAAVLGHQAMQLVGKHMHDAARPPSTAFVRGVWKRPN